MKKDYIRKSVLAGYIGELIAEKRSMGFSYIFEEYVLNIFDDYCISHKLEQPCYDRAFLKEWLRRKDSEGESYQSQRISFVRQLSLYLNSVGISAYIPVESIKKHTPVPHILNSEERTAFFRALDSNQPKVSAAYAWRMWNEYRVIFRLIYSCGLRNSEAAGLKAEHVDLKKGSISIIHSKGDKDRLVYLANDMTALMTAYWAYLSRMLDHEPEWFFPSKNQISHVDKTTLDYQFNRYWKQTEYSKSCNKKPTVHSLRHSFVVDRINAWITEGRNLDQLRPYLSRYLGHKSFSETMQYYHLTEDTDRIIRKNDQTAGRVIPEVEKYVT